MESREQRKIMGQLTVTIIPSHTAIHCSFPTVRSSLIPHRLCRCVPDQEGPSNDEPAEECADDDREQMLRGGVGQRAVQPACGPVAAAAAGRTDRAIRAKRAKSAHWSGELRQCNASRSSGVCAAAAAGERPALTERHSGQQTGEQSQLICGEAGRSRSSVNLKHIETAAATEAKANGVRSGERRNCAASGSIGSDRIG